MAKRHGEELDPAEFPKAFEECVRLIGQLKRDGSVVKAAPNMKGAPNKERKPEPEEEFLGAVHALILKCFKQPLSPADKVASPVL